MLSFLEQLAQYHLKNYLTDISDFCFVFPSQRAGVFFRKHLSENTPGAMWSPRIMTITDFFGCLNPEPISDNISLVFKLFNTYQNIFDSNLSLDEFIPWGEMCLADFDDLDKYLVDADKLYRNLANQKALEDDFSHLSKEQIDAIRTFWSTFNPEKHSKLQASFLEIWEKMPELYNTFNTLLDTDHEAYEGKIYRKVANQIMSRTLPELPYKKIIFAGFNALNNCEKKLFNYLKIKGQATFFWDYPEWIGASTSSGTPGRSSTTHEALRFISDNLQDFPMPDDWQNPSPQQPPKITIATAANDLAQTQVAGDFLREMVSKKKDEMAPQDHLQPSTPKSSAFAQTALVLADESLLLPSIHAIPKEWGKINVTLGYPLKNTPAYGLIEALIMMQKTTRTTRQGKTWFYHRHLIGLLRHQYISTILGEEGTTLLKDLSVGNQIFIEKSQLPLTPLMETLLTPIHDSQSLSSYLSSTLKMVYEHLTSKEGSALEREFIYHLYLNIKRLGEILSAQDVTLKIDTWHRLFKKLADFQTVPFQGEPLSGLQVMGILETRALDFDHLIILSMNEGVFPHTAAPNSFIPFNLRKGYGLPTIDHQDSIFAYYFYRLIHRAKEVTLVWSSSNAQKQAGEMSRFLHQLYYESANSINITTYIQPAASPTHLEIHAQKNQVVLQQLQEYLNRGNRFLSPSALSTYIECPLRFYFKYLAGAKEADAISEDLDPRTFGNLFHQTVERIYTPLINKLTNESKIEEATTKELVHRTLKEVFAINVPFIKQTSNLFTDLQGKNSLVYEVLLRYLNRFFKLEALEAPFTIKALEAPIKMVFTNHNGLKINLGGNIDRLDTKEGTTRVIDYKTGNGDNSINNIEELFDTKKHAKKKAIFQTLLYSLMVADKQKSINNIAPQVIWMKNLFNQNYTSSLFLQQQRQKKETIQLDLVHELFVEQLSLLLDEIFNEDTPFLPTDHPDNCSYCLYKEICLR